MEPRWSALLFIIVISTTVALGGCATESSTSLDGSATGLTVVSSPSTIDGVAGVPYGGAGGVVFTIAGGVTGATYYWTTTGDLPPGLVRTPADNQTPSDRLVISGTPECSGTTTLKITVHSSPDHNILIPFKDFFIPIAGDSAFLEISPSTVPWPAILASVDPEDPSKRYQRTLSICGGRPPYRWSASSLPSGTVFDSSNGTISQTAATSSGKFQIPVSVVDGAGRTAQRTITLWVLSIADFKGTWTGIATKGAFLVLGTDDQIDEELAGHRVSFLLNDQGVLLQGAMHDRVIDPHKPGEPPFNFGIDYPTQLGGYMFQFPWHLDCVPRETDQGELELDCVAHYLSDNPIYDAEFTLKRVSTATAKDLTPPTVSSSNFDPTSRKVTVTFSEPMSTGTAIAPVGSAESVVFSDDGTIATIQLTVPAAAASTVTLNPSGQPAVRPGFVDRAGNALAKTDINLAGQQNQPPIALDMLVPVVHDRSKAFDLTATDPEDIASGLIYTIISGPGNGTISSGTGQARTYTPNLRYVGLDSFVFTATDSGNLTSAPATVTINITNAAPTATAQSVGAQLGVARLITLAGSDSDNDSLTYTIVAQPAMGTLSGTPPALTYTGNSVGADSFTFRVSDGLTPSAPATVSVNVTSSNQAPTATPQSVSTVHGQAKVITLVGTDPEGGALTYTVVSQPTQGTLAGSGNTRTYTPASGTYFGPDSFTFKVTDPGSLESAPATVSITVTNQSPTATPQNVTAAQGVQRAITLAGSDPDLDSLTYAIVTQPTNGTLTGTPPNMSYTGAAPGSDSFTFTVSDGIATSAPATVSITVTQPNQPPTATPQSVSTVHGRATAITLAGTDPENGALTYNIVTQPSQGALTGSGNARTYTPTSATYTGSDSFTFTVTDLVGLVSSAATVSITITNQAPTATPQSVTVSTGTPKVITLTGSDLDGDSPLTFAVGNSPSNGILSAVSGSSVTYTPNGGYNGPDSFTFTASDGVVASSPATVTLNVAAGNAVPVANSQTVEHIFTRQYTTKPTFVFYYAITLTGSDAEDGTSSPPLHFKITDLPDTWDSTKPMSMVAGNQYRRWNGSSWEIFTATTSTTVNLVTGDITVSPAGSPVTIIYTPPACHFDPRLFTTMEFTVTDSSGQTSLPGTVGIRIDPLTCSHPG